MKNLLLLFSALNGLAISAQAGDFELSKIQVDGGSGEERSVVRCKITDNALAKSVEIFDVTSTSTVGLSTHGNLEAIVKASNGVARPDFSHVQGMTNYWARDKSSDESKLLSSEIAYEDGTKKNLKASAPESHQLVRYLNRVCGSWR